MEPQPHRQATITWNNLNLSNCSLQIDDERKVIKEITDKIKKFAHVPVQT
jgi:predicted transcriptional regulator